jgi:acyl-CoA synthetase (AMP-forming)/AMP-acid ligase II
MLVALLAACRATPDAPALTQGKRTVSFAELRSRMERVGASLRSMGFQPGDRVLFSARPSLDGIALALGVIAVGGAVVSVDPKAGDAMFRARAALARPRWVAADSRLYLVSSRPLRGIARHRRLRPPPLARIVPDARRLYVGQWLPGVPRTATGVSQLLDGPASPVEPSVTAEHEALVLFTSGTAAELQVVVHSRASLGARFSDFASQSGLVPGDRLSTDEPMIGVPALLAGAHWTLPPPGVDPEAAPERYLAALPVTDVLFLAPSSLDAVLTLLDAKPRLAPALTILLIGGGTVSPPLLLRAQVRFPAARILATPLATM